MVILLAASPETSRLCLPDWGNWGLKILSAPLSESLRVNQDDQASECQQGKVEMTPELLAELENKARQKGLSLFAYLADFVMQDDDNSPTTRSRSRFE
jgi:hypothetical protein